jgi:hypothetical protein
MLIVTVDGTVTGFGLANPKLLGERGVAPIWWTHERLRAASPRRSSRATYQTALPGSVPR